MNSGVGQKQARVGLFCPRYLQHIRTGGSGHSCGNPLIWWDNAFYE
jgi:hypothetical protein